MKRCEKLIEKRNEYIRKEVATATSTTAKVQELSGRLFISERTVWRIITDKTE